MISFVLDVGGSFYFAIWFQKIIKKSVHFLKQFLKNICELILRIVPRNGSNSFSPTKFCFETQIWKKKRKEKVFSTYSRSRHYIQSFLTIFHKTVNIKQLKH